MKAIRKSHFSDGDFEKATDGFFKKLLAANAVYGYAFKSFPGATPASRDNVKKAAKPGNSRAFATAHKRRLTPYYSLA